ncbi:ABC transporter permease [Paenibacillus sp. R14(2021)]|uniref:ABC transporter permease n=1 Tax=Paenibacillus sp. R14(2021) TaxID=2859228 RepID=UPI001C61679F|nr:ABC-2 family transporter protein [Paenibacillus sp. R14(2021)]
MRGSIAAFLSVMRTVVASRLAYRGDLYFSMLVTLLGETVLPLITLLIYRSGASFPGWSLSEVMLIQAVFMLAKGLAYPFFFGMVYNTLDRVQDGTFDVLLLKPRSALFMTLVTGFSIDGLGRLLGGLALFLIALTGVHVPGAAAWLGFIMLMVMSVCILFASALFMSGMLFHWVGSSRVYEIHDSITAFGRYPRTIYAKPLQWILTYVLPVAMIAFLPASTLLGRANAGLAGAIAFSVVFLAAGLLFWHGMLRKYSSAGG